MTLWIQISYMQYYLLRIIYDVIHIVKCVVNRLLVISVQLYLLKLMHRWEQLRMNFLVNVNH
ncbi:unnamed protein product, partial [Trichobilharzia regenti]